MPDEKTAFVVCVEMSQREPYVAEKAIAQEWRYNLFGHFDEMRIRIGDKLEDFSIEKRDSELSELDSDKRMRHHPETKKVFLYVEENPNAPNEQKAHLTRLLSECNDLPMIALVALKLRLQFFEEPLPCNPCKCIEYFLNKCKAEKNASADFCIMNALNLYDVYVLMRTDNPNFVLHCVRQLQNFVCDFTCESIPPKENKDIFVNKSKKILENMKSELVQLDLEETDKQNLTTVIDSCVTRISEQDPFLCPIATITEISDPLREYLKTAKSLALQDLVLKCIQAVRACGPMPLVLQTHSIVGCREGLKPDNVSEEIVLFELQLQLRPGSGVEEIMSKITPYFSDIYMVLGRYYYVCQGEISFRSLLELYEQDFFSWKKIDASPIQYSSGRFLLKEDGSATTNAQLSEMKELMLVEDTRFSILWGKEQHQSVANLIQKIKKHIDEFPFLKPITNSVSLLHMQGCRRLFYALSWNEYLDTRDFFCAFFEKLGYVFDQMEKKSSDERTQFAWMAHESMLVFLKKMSGLFQDRMVLDMSMHENTRSDVYATGAYEKLIKRYSGWIKDLSSLLGKLENPYDVVGSDSLHFVLVPVEQDSIHSHILFPMDGENGKTLVIYEMTFNKMLDITDALGLLVHETGHYLGVVDREDRIKTYLIMVAYCYAMRVTRALCMCGFTPIPIDIVWKSTINLGEAMYEYLLSCLERRKVNRKKQREGYYLDHVAYYCRLWLDDFLKEVMSSPSNVIDSKMESLISNFVDLYNVLDAAPLATGDGRLLGMLAEYAMEPVLNNCKTLIRECYADFLAIHVIKLDKKGYFSLLLNALQIRDTRASAMATTQKVDTSTSRNIDAIRAISALMMIKFMETKDDVSFTTLLSEIPDAVSKSKGTLCSEIKSSLRKTGRYLHEAMMALIGGEKALKSGELPKDGEKFNNNDFLILWRSALAPHLYKAGQTIKKKLNNDKGDYSQALNKMRSRYNAIESIQGIESVQGIMRLITFLGEEEVS